MGPLGRRSLSLAALVLVGFLSPALGQDLAPRAYWPAPVGTKVVSIGVAYQTGEVVSDPSLPVQDATASLTAAQAGFLRIFSLAGRTASLGVVVPRPEGTVKAIVEEIPVRRDLQGLGDVSLTFGLNFVGAPAMSPEEFQLFRKAPRSILGMSLEVRLPVGQYDANRVINLGGNRWAVKPEIGYIVPLGNAYLLEANLGGWLYGRNDDFNGEEKIQDPLVSMEIHLVRRQRGPFWTSLDLTFYRGGRTEVGGELNDDRLSNVRAGATVAFPLKKGHLVRFAGSTSLATAKGGSYDSFLLAYVKAWQ